MTTLRGCSYLGDGDDHFPGDHRSLPWAQTTEPILRMELGTHNAAIFALAMDPANRILVTGSEDKTIRVWDIANGASLLRILRPPAGDWEQGQIFAVALAPDGRTIACGGRTGSPKQGDGCVYLFDRETGALVQRLGGLPGFVQHLAYTGDGRFLAAVTGERGGMANWSGMHVFRLPDYTLVAQDRDYGNLIQMDRKRPIGRQTGHHLPGRVRSPLRSVRPGNPGSRHLRCRLHRCPRSAHPGASVPGGWLSPLTAPAWPWGLI